MAKKWSGERLETFVYNETTIEHLHRYAIAMEYVKDKTVLDIACGEGYGANLLADRAQRVTGIDIDRATISNARKKYIKQNLEFIEGPVEKIPVTNNVFDVVVSFETLEHTSEHEKMMAEIKRVLKPGGILIISTPDKKHYSDIPGSNNPFHQKELYEDEFIALLKKFFSYHHCFYQALALSSLAWVRKGSELNIYEGNYESIRAKESIEPVYLVALASDSEIVRPSSSIFLGRSILQAVLEEKERAVKNTLSYRVGHFLLWPLKWLRNVLGKGN